MKASERRRVLWMARLGKRKGHTIDTLVENAIKCDIDGDEARALITEAWDNIPMPDEEADEKAAKAAAKLPQTVYTMPTTQDKSI